MNKKVYHLLEQKYQLYNNPGFIEADPVSIPRSFRLKEDIEIAGLLTATIAWGQRKSILNQARKMMHALDDRPYKFIMQATEKELWEASRFFTYRTFNPDDGLTFLTAIRQLYQHHGGMEAVFTRGYLSKQKIKGALEYFREVFFTVEHLNRTEKHISNVRKGASAKRLNMFLRWMVRDDDRGVDFGLWRDIDPAHLMLPLDVHTGKVSRSLGLLERRQDDWKAVEELTARLSIFDPHDPVKYDFALFGMGVNEQL
jgi:uncharacterized protein (TIGR02757 family)